jgi:uncharacterized protein (TIGR03790 family)
MSVAIRRAGLQDRLLYLVLTKGVPLRIAGTSGIDGTLASVDSELTLLYRRMVGQPVSSQGKIDNPYFLGDRPISQAFPFTHREHDIYLVTRLDAFTVDEALALIDRAQAPASEGRIVLDRRGAGGTSSQWLERAAQRLVDQEKTSLLEAAPDQPTLGYYSAASSATTTDRAAKLSFTAGSIGANFTSFDARTFHEPPDDWRPTSSGDKKTWFEGSGAPLIGDLIRAGVSGVAGQVGEPYLLGSIRPEILFPAYLAGFNLAEAFYLSVPSLSWQTVVIGDPLCAAVPRNPLDRTRLEAAADPATGLPGLFAKRRLTTVRASNPDVSEGALTAFVKSQTLLDRGDRVGGRRALEQAVALAPRAAGMMTMLAQLEEDAGDYDAAIARYWTILGLQPTSVVAMNNLAYALAVRQNRPGEALSLAKRAASLAPRVGLLLDTLGWIEHLLGDNRAAASDLAQALEVDPDQPSIHLHAAFVFAAIGDIEKAGTELKAALMLNPSLSEQEDVRKLQVNLRNGTATK